MIIHFISHNNSINLMILSFLLGVKITSNIESHMEEIDEEVRN